VSLATVLHQLIPSSSSVFTPCDRAFEHHASMEVVKMSLKILDPAHGFPGAAFAVTFVPVLLGLLVVAYCANIFHWRSRCLAVRGHCRNISSRPIAWDLSCHLRWLFRNLWIFGPRPSPGPLLISSTVVMRRRSRVRFLTIPISIRKSGTFFS
jgi:hypothetical protein